MNLPHAHCLSMQHALAVKATIIIAARGSARASISLAVTHSPMTRGSLSAHAKCALALPRHLDSAAYCWRPWPLQLVLCSLQPHSLQLPCAPFPPADVPPYGQPVQHSPTGVSLQFCPWRGGSGSFLQPPQYQSIGRFCPVLRSISADNSAK